MNRPCPPCRLVRVSTFVISAMITSLVCTALAFFPAAAYADGGVELVEVWFVSDGETNVSTSPHRFGLEFSKNVGFASDGRDDAFIEHNIGLVKLMTKDGRVVEGVTILTGTSREERQLLKIQTDEYLKPLTEYQIVVESGLQAANGEDVSTEQYVISFKTNDLCKNGLTVFQNALIIVVPILLVTGIVAALVKRKKQT